MFGFSWKFHQRRIFGQKVTNMFCKSSGSGHWSTIFKGFFTIWGRENSAYAADNSGSCRQFLMKLLSGGISHWQQTIPFWWWSESWSKYWNCKWNFYHCAISGEQSCVWNEIRSTNHAWRNFRACSGNWAVPYRPVKGRYETWGGFSTRNRIPNSVATAKGNASRKTVMVSIYNTV